MKPNESANRALEWARKHLRFRSVVRPMIYVCLFSIMYMLGYWGLISLPVGSTLDTFLVWIWVSLFGLALYFCAGLCWGKKQGTLSLKSVGWVMAWNLAATGLVSWVLSPFYLHIYSHVLLCLPLQIAAAAYLILFVPATIVVYRAIYCGCFDIGRIWNRFVQLLRTSFSRLCNGWIIFFLVMMVWDDLFGGPLGSQAGFDAVILLSNLIYLGAPFGYPVLLLLSGTSAPGIAELVLLSMMISVVWDWVWMNLIASIGNLAGDFSEK